MESIVKALNNFVKNNYSVEGHFVGHQSYSINKNFNAFKTYRLCLYYVNKGVSHLIIEEYTSVKDVDEKDINKHLNIKFLEAIYDYVASDEFADLMYGNINI